MKKLVLIGLCLFLGACTKSELKSHAVKDAQSQYLETLNKEIENVTMPGKLRDNYISYLKNTASFDVTDIKMNGDQNANVSVRMQAVATENRHTLAKIAAGVEPSTAGRFNMGNAINLIEQQPGQVKGPKETLFFLKYHRSGDNWVLEQ